MAIYEFLSGYVMLTCCVFLCVAMTVMGLEVELQVAADELKESHKSSISLAAACDLFNRFVTRISYDIPDFETFKRKLVERGQEFAAMSIASRKKISNLLDRFISDKKVLLLFRGTWACSRLLLRLGAFASRPL